MLPVIILLGAIAAALYAIHARRLQTSAIALAVVSALLSLILYLIGARELAVIELSIGAGLVTVLLVFAITLAGDAPGDAAAMPFFRRAFAYVVVVLLVLVGPAALLLFAPSAASEPAFSAALWEDRPLDLLVQIALIFTGAVSVLALVGAQAVQARRAAPAALVARAAAAPRPAVPVPTSRPAPAVAQAQLEEAR